MTIGLKSCMVIMTLALCVNASAQTKSEQLHAEQELAAYFAHYRPKDSKQVMVTRLKKLRISPADQSVRVEMDAAFGQQEFTDRQVGRIYKHVRSALPRWARRYQLQVVTCGLPIEELVPGHRSTAPGITAAWGTTTSTEAPWVRCTSLPFTPTHGLQGHHLSLWASHGRYYDQSKGQWRWQRPLLFGTTEDLFTQTIVVPYLIPMLEKAGAVVFTPRERDWQTAEYVVDPDGGLASQPSDYMEQADGAQWQQAPTRGFAAPIGTLTDGQNPFQAGQARMVKASKKAGKAWAKWQPNFAQSGRYAVYVSYVSTDKSVDDAHYTVFHKGQATEFRVNQRMGGGTWVYLGTFDFEKGDNLRNCVMLTSQSNRRGVVTADAVRFGGGMGNVERGGTKSGMPRALEGARYWAQWAGAPYTVYSQRGGTDDYADDINVRSLMTNWLAGGSPYVPTLQGLKVPIEMSLAVHSDAGFSPNGKDLVGSLAICTTQFNGGQLASGLTRQTSRWLADSLLTGVTRDLTARYGTWARRYLWDRNYSETRLPEVPSAIIETMSHQNFPDMVKGQDPNFRFTLARSLYKTLLRQVNSLHGQQAVVQPLPPIALSVEQVDNNHVRLSWSAQTDELEPTAQPTAYCLYTARGRDGFDNGRLFTSTQAVVEVPMGVPTHFRVTAVNRGGESFPTHVVSTLLQPNAKKTILVIDGFRRLSAPAVVNTPFQQGFDLTQDPGVSQGLTAGWAGPQRDFNIKTMGTEGPGGLGFSGNEWAGQFIAGNDENYTIPHTEAIATTKDYNVVSCTIDAVEAGKLHLNKYDVIDLILGLERYTAEATRPYKTFTPTMREQLTPYLMQGGKLLVSGAYIGSDMTQEDEKDWLAQFLHCQWQGQIVSPPNAMVQGLGLTFQYISQLNAQHYAAHHVDALSPIGTAFVAMQYADGQGAAVAYSNAHGAKTIAMGFPWECITEENTRNAIMRGILRYLDKGEENKTNDTP